MLVDRNWAASTFERFACAGPYTAVAILPQLSSCRVTPNAPGRQVLLYLVTVESTFGGAATASHRFELLGLQAID